MSISGFSVTVDQNPYLPAGGRNVNAIVTVTADATGEAGPTEPPGGNAEVVILDCSGSMDYPPAKLTEARAATVAALDVIRDGTWFAIIAGSSTAWPVYPPDGSMAVADGRTRAEARAALRHLRAHGGTAIGQWLRLAHRLLSASPATLRHAILLTDGKNQHERPEDLAAVVGQCAGVFRCDCRGIGTDWDVGELRMIAAALDGGLDIVVDPADLTAHFADLMRESMRKRLPDVLLRVWTPRTATVKFIKQVAPAIEDLTGRRRATDAGAQVGDYPTGPWAPGESRDYHVAVTVNPAHQGQEMLAARICVLAGQSEGEQVLGRGMVRATWTDDEELSTRIDPHVAGYTGQAELAAAIAEGLDASRRGDEESAAARLGRAVALACAAGNKEIARLLADLVHVVDEASGSVRLRGRTDADAEMALDTRSTKTNRVAKSGASGEKSSGGDPCLHRPGATAEPGAALADRSAQLAGLRSPW